MPVSKEPRLGYYLDAFRAWLPTVKLRFLAWLEACREQPILIWHTSAVRYSVYGIVGLIAILTIRGIANSFVPPVLVERAETADIQVLCSDPNCGKLFVINREFDFDDFPVKCPACQKETGVRALRCASPTCGGILVAPQKSADGRKLVCPRCQSVLGDAD